MLGPFINTTIIKELVLVSHLLIIATAIQDSTRIWEVHFPIVFLQLGKGANQDVKDWLLLDPQAKVLNQSILNIMKVNKYLYLLTYLKSEINVSIFYTYIFTFC